MSLEEEPDISNQTESTQSPNITDKKIAILAGSGVGKTTLLRYFQQNYPEFPVADIAGDEYIGQFFDQEKFTSLPEDEKFPYWSKAELNAAIQASENNIRLIAGLMNWPPTREFLISRGYNLVVLSIPELIHAARLEQRKQEEGREYDLRGSREGQCHLESLGLPIIDATQTPAQIAELLLKHDQI